MGLADLFCVAFPENATLKAHPSKSGGDWWYGTVIASGKSGIFPQTYVETYKTGKGAPSSSSTHRLIPYFIQFTRRRSTRTKAPVLNNSRSTKKTISPL